MFTKRPTKPRVDIGACNSMGQGLGGTCARVFASAKVSAPATGMLQEIFWGDHAYDRQGRTLPRQGHLLLRRDKHTPRPRRRDVWDPAPTTNSVEPSSGPLARMTHCTGDGDQS